MRLSWLTALCLALAPIAAAAQERAPSLTAEDARNFVTRIAEEARTAVEEGDWQGIVDWIDQHVADDAPVALQGSLLISSGPAMTYTVSMKGADLTRTAQMSIASPASLVQSVEDYALETEVMNALELPGGKVSLAVTFYETGQIQPPSGQDAAPGGIAGAFSSEASCSMRLGGAPEEVVIEMAACDVRSML